MIRPTSRPQEDCDGREEQREAGDVVQRLARLAECDLSIANSIATLVNVSGATPSCRPAHHAARSASASQPRLRSGERTSLRKKTIPSV